MNPEARKWYEASAAQGDLYAMIQLGRSKKDFFARFQTTALPIKNHPLNG
jgi:hypothetical protein